MARTAGDLDNSAQLTANTNSSNNFVQVAIGGTGAVGAVTGCPGISFTRTGAGTYTMVYPAAVNVLLIPVVVLSAAPTVFYAVVTARNPTAGTATFKTYNAAGTATDPASGDIIGFELLNKLSAL